MEPIENKSQKIDRVVLDKKSIDIVQQISAQVESVVGDIVQLSQKDIVNFLIQERGFLLTEVEIDKIKSEHFDMVKALRRATQEAIKAKQDGYDLKIDDILKIIQTSENSVHAKVSKVRKARNKNKVISGAVEPIIN